MAIAIAVSFTGPAQAQTTSASPFQIVEASIDDIHTLAEADRLDAAFRTSGLAGPLHGIAILVKDEIDTAGMPTTLGTVVFKDYRPPKDAFVIDKLRKAGAIILGKATLSEFAAGDTYGSIFGVTRNPYDLERTVGGSSGGSGAALAANFSTVTIGEETVASIRRVLCTIQCPQGREALTRWAARQQIQLARA